MSAGYVVTVAVWGAVAALCLRPLGRSGARGRITWMITMVPNEAPALIAAAVLAATVPAAARGDLGSPAGVGVAAVAAATVVVAVVLVRRALAAGPVLDRALEAGLGPGWRGAAGAPARPARRWPSPRAVVFPVPVRHPSVRRVRGVRYGDDPRDLLDIYHHRSTGTGRPVFIHLHGGAFRSGGRSREARPLLHGLARRGWLCISADYRLRPRAVFPDQLVDVTGVIAWARAHAADLGADPARIVVAGSSAGAHLATLAAFTAGDPRFAPGLDGADARVAAAVGLYGYYGRIDTGRRPDPSSPLDHVHPGAPPVLLIHGAGDTVVTPGHARDAAQRMGAVSDAPVVYAELPGAQHSFDLLRSVRMEFVVDAVEAFARAVLAGCGTARAPGDGPRRARAVP